MTPLPLANLDNQSNKSTKKPLKPRDLQFSGNVQRVVPSAKDESQAPSQLRFWNILREAIYMLMMCLLDSLCSNQGYTRLPKKLASAFGVHIHLLTYCGPFVVYHRSITRAHLLRRSGRWASEPVAVGLCMGQNPKRYPEKKKTMFKKTAL